MLASVYTDTNASGHAVDLARKLYIHMYIYRVAAIKVRNGSDALTPWVWVTPGWRPVARRLDT